MPELHWTEVDGVKTVWIDVSGVSRAGLFFRAGRADETLVTSGHTHLIEHMALENLTDPLRNNGFVDDVTTGFMATGYPNEVADFLGRICTSLGSLREQDLDVHRRILTAEDAARPYNLAASLLSYRFGSSSFGLTTFREIGIHDATLEKLEALRLQRFTRENGILWLTQPPSTGLRLDLPPGQKLSLPELDPIEQVLPGCPVGTWTTPVAAPARGIGTSGLGMFSLSHNGLPPAGGQTAHRKGDQLLAGGGLPAP